MKYSIDLGTAYKNFWDDVVSLFQQKGVVSAENKVFKRSKEIISINVKILGGFTLLSSSFLAWKAISKIGHTSGFLLTISSLFFSIFGHDLIVAGDNIRKITEKNKLHEQFFVNFKGWEQTLLFKDVVRVILAYLKAKK